MGSAPAGLAQLAAGDRACYDTPKYDMAAISILGLN